MMSFRPAVWRGGLANIRDNSKSKVHWKASERSDVPGRVAELANPTVPSNHLGMIRLPAFDDDYNQERFVEGQRPLFWLQTARDLAEAAEIIMRSHIRTETGQRNGRSRRRRIAGDIYRKEYEPVSYQPANLLYAFAIENVIKGIVVGQNNNLIAEDKLDKVFRNTRHDLVRICREGNVNIADDEIEILEKLTQTIKWAGRYPTPNNMQDTLPKSRDGKRDYPGISYWGDDRERMRALYRRLDAVLGTMLYDKYSEARFIGPGPSLRRKSKRV